MRLLPDEELFGMIPQADGSHTSGNMLLPIHPSLRSAYIHGLMDSGVFPEHIHGSYSFNPDVRGQEAQMRSHAEANLLIPIFNKAFHVADQAIEDHLEETNGFISRFPSSKMEVYPNMERKFDYFYYAPKDYVPPAEERLKDAHAALHQNHASASRGKNIWFLLATLAFALVLLGGRIYSLIPQLGAWASESQGHFYIQIGIILLFLEIIGCFVPGSWWNVDFTNNTLGFLIMLGGIFAWGYLYFPGTTGPAPEDGVVRVFYYLIKWPFIGYFAFIWICYTVNAITAMCELKRYRKKYSSYEQAFVKIYEEDIQKLHRYLRLRQLWKEHEKTTDGFWVWKLSQRLDAYHAEYKRIRKNLM